MKLSRQFHNPAAELFSEFDQFINRAFSRSPLVGTRRSDGAFGVYEEHEAWHLRTDLPGFAKKDVSLRLEDGVLHLGATQQEGEPSFHSRVERTFRVPDNIDPARIEARLENGVLEVVLPKHEVKEPESLHIEIQ